MDPISFQLDTKNEWVCLVRLLSNDPEWLNAKMKFFLPNMDLGSRNEAPDPTKKVFLQLQELQAQGPATWQAFIHCVCMELEVPLDLEVLLLSTWGHEGGGKGVHERCRQALKKLGPTQVTPRRQGPARNKMPCFWTLPRANFLKLPHQRETRGTTPVVQGGRMQGEKGRVTPSRQEIPNSP